MKRAMFILGVLLPTFASAQVGRTVDFSEHPDAATVASEGVEVTLSPSKSDDGIEVSAAIRVPGFQSIIVREGGGTYAGYPRWVGIGKLSKSDASPSVLLESFSGGAHCCAELRAIVPVAGRLKVIDFEAVDGDIEKLFPKDVDGDGTVDFVRQDDRFRYTFASGAGSFSPPVILNVYKGQIVDVSDQASFQTMWEKFAKQTHTRCIDRTDEDRNGACAAFVAAGARLGHFEAAMAEADKYANPKPSFGFPEGCSIDTKDVPCPKDKIVKFFQFKTALRWFLENRGYIGASR